MDGWDDFSEFDKAVYRLTAAVVGVSALVGAAIGWVGHQLFEHLHTESRSDHFQGRG